MKAKICTITDRYHEYLEQYEGRIPKLNYTDANGKKLKPLLALLVEDGDYYWVSNLSSKKSRHDTMKNSKDFKKIYINGKFTSVVNLNYSFPVPKSEVIFINSKNIEQYCDFKDELSKNKYLGLLTDERRYVDEKNFDESLKQLFNHVNEHPSDKISMRCFKFNELLSHAKNFNVINASETLKIEPKENDIWDLDNDPGYKKYLDNIQNSRKKDKVLKM